jgi:hypothetical protein
MPINIQPNNDFMIPSEEMVFGFEFKKLGSKRYSSSKKAEESSVLPQLNRSPNPKGADKLRSKSAVGPRCSDPKQKEKQDAEGNIRTRESAKRRGNEGDELVKHMSNLPGYLLHNDRLENVQEKAFNVGVLDWSRLENWKHKTIPEELTSRFTPFNRGESSSRIANKSSTRGKEKLDDKRGLRHIRPNTRESLPQSSKLPLENVERFESSRSGSKSIGNEQRRNDHIKRTSDVANSASNSRHRRVSSSVPNENANGKDKHDEYSHKKKERNHKSSSDMGQPSVKPKSKGDSLSSKKMSSGDRESREKVNQLQESGFDDSSKHDNSKPSNIVLLYPHEIPDSSSDDFPVSEFRTSSDENFPESSRSSLSYVSIPEEVDLSNVGPEIQLSSGHRSVVEHASLSGPVQYGISADLGTNRSSAVSENSASKINKMSDLQSEAACFEKDVLDNKPSNQSAFSNLIESLDQETAELISHKGSNPSHNRRFSFSLSRIGRSFSFKEGPAVSHFNSKYGCSLSGPVTPESSLRWDTSRKEKTNGQNRTRSSPLKRLLDPILKHKTAASSETHHSGDSSQIRKRSMSSSSFRSISINESLQDEKGKVSSIQGLLQLTIKNEMPLFKFVLNDEKKIYAATKNSLASQEKNDLGCSFTFYSVNEIKKKSGGWMSHGNKEKNCGYAYNVVAQMKSSSSKITEVVNQNSMRQHVVKEYVLLGVEIDQTDQGPPKLIPSMELAAVVVETSCENLSNKRLHSNNDFLKKGENDSSTVILPGGVHGSPNKGEPSSLIHRWKTGGSCDCGGWDIGCKLLVLQEQKQSSNILRSYKPYQDCFHLFVQVYTPLVSYYVSN